MVQMASKWFSLKFIYKGIAGSDYSRTVARDAIHGGRGDTMKVNGVRMGAGIGEFDA